MSKITFSKIKYPEKDFVQEKEVQWYENSFIVKQFLPTEKKLKLIEEILTAAVDEEYGYFNPIRLDLIATLLIIKEYSNITFTQKQLGEDFFKTIDKLDKYRITDVIIDAIPKEEYDSLIKTLEECSAAIERYNCSAGGLLSRLTSRSDDLKADIAQIQEGLSGENLELVKDLLTKLS